MIKRLAFGVLEGIAVAAVVVFGLRALGADWSSTAVVYTATVAAGVLTGLVAGRPLWRGGAKVEAVIKSAVGTFLSVATMYGIRKWLPHATVNLGALGEGPLGSVPAAALPLIASAVAIVFEIDDEFGSSAGKVQPPQADAP